MRFAGGSSRCAEPDDDPEHCEKLGAGDCEPESGCAENEGKQQERGDGEDYSAQEGVEDRDASAFDALVISDEGDVGVPVAAESHNGRIIADKRPARSEQPKRSRR